MKLFLIKFIYTFLSCVVIICLTSCSILDYEEGQNKSKYSQNNVKKNKCPSAKIPSKTGRYISSKEYILRIKKIEMSCKSEVLKSCCKIKLHKLLKIPCKLELLTSHCFYKFS